MDLDVTWRLATQGGQTVGEGRFTRTQLKQGMNTQVGDFTVNLSTVTKATKATLTVRVEGTPWYNSWNIWIFPPINEMPQEGIVVTSDVNEALAELAKGSKVLLSTKPEQVKGLEGKFVPVFWSPVHFPHQAGTMGLLCHPNHPAMAAFPTEINSDWQWWSLTKRQKVMVIDSIPGFTPIVESVDNFTNNRRLASVVETRVGQGQLLLSTMDLFSESSDPAVAQLLFSFLQYMQSDKFRPQGNTSADVIKQLIH